MTRGKRIGQVKISLRNYLDVVRNQPPLRQNVSYKYEYYCGDEPICEGVGSTWISSSNRGQNDTGDKGQDISPDETRYRIDSAYVKQEKIKIWRKVLTISKKVVLITIEQKRQRRNTQMHLIIRTRTQAGWCHNRWNEVSAYNVEGWDHYNETGD